jgi:predicted nucleotidyltransferase
MPGDERPANSYISEMNAQAALDTLRRSESALRARGVRHAALFGSMARGDNRPDSDIDILVEFDPDARVTVFDYAGVKDYIAGLFEQPVDVIDREALKPHLREPSARDAVYAF